MKLSTFTQKSNQLKPITIQKTVSLTQQNINGKPECPLFKLPCGPMSQKNIETLKNQKQENNQTQFKLSSTKSLFSRIIPLQRTSNESGLQGIMQNSDFKQIRKSICLSGRGKNKKQKDIINRQEQHNMPVINYFGHQSQVSLQLNSRILQKTKSTSQKICQFGPLSINKRNEDIKTKIVGQINYSQTRQSFIMPSSSSLKLNTLNETSYSSYSEIVKPHVFVHQDNYQEPKITLSFTYSNKCITQSLPQNNHAFNESQNSSPSSIQLQIKQHNTLSCNNLNNSTDHSCIKYDQQTHCHTLNVSPPQLPNCKTTNQIFENIQIQKPQKIIKSNNQQLILQNYSSKYQKNIMKQIFHPNKPIQSHEQDNIINLMKSVRVQCDSVNQEQNQKYQTTFFTQGLKLNQFQQQRISHQEQIYSSFAVINQKKEIQNQRRVYFSSHIGYSQILDNNFTDQTNHKANFDQQPQISNEERLQIYQDIEQSMLINQIDKLSQNLDSLIEQQKLLILQRQSIVSKQLKELQRLVEQLQSLQIISEQRCRDIQVLKQLIKVKKIYQICKSSQQISQKYLNNEKGWESYISQEQQFNHFSLLNQTGQREAQDNRNFFKRQLPYENIQFKV